MALHRTDYYHRALKEYRKVTAESASCEHDRRALAQSNVDDDVLVATKYLCNIEEDWIVRIEEGLEFVEKAVAEERQFIRTDGEVVPIEKVKKTSKDTVEHLAKHSDLITHLPENEGDDVIPDKLYMVEKLSDYAVYENRFLYMLLCYLRDFINFRLEKIEALRHTYSGKLSISKDVVKKNRTLSIRATVDDNRENNPYPIVDEKSDGLLERIKNCQQIVTSLLNTELMTQVAKSPMIKPPIVKTNVLKMNNNFKRALALYDYVATYKGLGYTYDTVRYDLVPFVDKIADEIAEAANLLAFLEFKYGNGIDDLLETNYKEEENRRKILETKRLEERIKRLKKRALESNKTLEEYALLLEERNQMLEKDSEELHVIRQEIEALNRQVNELNLEKADLLRHVESLQATIAEREAEIERLNQKYIEDMAAVKKQHDEEVAQLVDDHKQAVAALNATHADEVTRLQVDFAERMQTTMSEHEQQVAALQNEITAFADSKREYERGIEDIRAREAGLDATLQKQADSYEAKMRDLEKSYQNEFALRDKAADDAIAGWQQENLYIRTELDGLRAKNGLLTPSEDYTSRDRFVELETEFEAFKRFFKGQWKLTKKAIRKEVNAERKNAPPVPPVNDTPQSSDTEL